MKKGADAVRAESRPAKARTRTRRRRPQGGSGVWCLFTRVQWARRPGLAVSIRVPKTKRQNNGNWNGFMVLRFFHSKTIVLLRGSAAYRHDRNKPRMQGADHIPLVWLLPVFIAQTGRPVNLLATDEKWKTGDAGTVS